MVPDVDDFHVSFNCTDEVVSPESVTISPFDIMIELPAYRTGQPDDEFTCVHTEPLMDNHVAFCAPDVIPFVVPPMRTRLPFGSATLVGSDRADHPAEAVAIVQL